ncbi:MAG: YihY/virulence factor BrkB family protein [Cytophagales bacterium]|nr:YihY/virulence factor BrkB family protein [Cytophaga sp.]
MIKKIKQTIVNHRYSVYGLNRLEKIKVGPRKISLIILIRIFLRKVNNDDINVRAKSITYDFFLSIFPGIIFLFTLIPYIPIEHLDEQILESLHDFFPGTIYESAESTIRDIISIPRKGLLSFGFLFAFYTANNGIISIINTFNHCYKTKDDRTFISKLGISMTILMLIFLVMVSGIVIGVISKFIYTGLEQEAIFSSMQLYFFALLRYFIMFFLFLMSISVIYYIAPSVHERWKFFSLGSITASLLCFLFTNIFSFYIEHFNSYNKVYGSIGALIGIMLWMYVNTLVLLVGFQLNASMDIANKKM